MSVPTLHKGQVKLLLLLSPHSLKKSQSSVTMWANSYNPEYKGDRLFLKMEGRKLYEYAMRFVPKGIKESIDEAGVDIRDIKKVMIHQANNKMDEAILKELYALYNITQEPQTVMPMTISWLGNSSVATIPTLYDLLSKGKMKNHKLEKGNYVVFASVGADMNINAITYKIPED